MKKINNKLKLLTVIGILVSISLSAQTDAVFIKQQVRLATDSMCNAFSQKDWNSFTNFMYPDLVKTIGTREEFIEFLQEQMAGISERANVDTMLTGNVLQLVKKNNQWQCLVENYIQMHVEGTLVSGVSNNIGFSDDNGKTWTFIRVEKGAEKKIKEKYPFISSKLNIPFGKNAVNTTIEELLKTYKPVYPATPVAKKVVKKKITKKK